MADTSNTATTTTASGTCSSHHQLMMLRQARLQDNQRQHQHKQLQQEHHLQPQQCQKQDHPQQQQDHHRSRCFVNTNVQSKHRLLVFTLCLLLIVSQAQATVRILVEPTSKSVAQGWTVVLNCTVADRGSGQVQWSQDDFGMGDERALPGFDRFSMIGVEQGSVGEYNLQIQEVQLKDEADYHCQVSPSIGSPGAMSRKAHLTVVVPPRRPYIEKAPTIPVVLHRPTAILCRADGGKPAPTITWVINGQRVTSGVTTRSTPDGKLVNATGVLTFNATHEDAAKRIECQAISQFMDSPFRTFATLDVQFPPNITLTYNVSSRNIREHDHVRFQCSGLANPAQVSWRWFRDNNIIKGAVTNVLDVNNIDPDYNNNVISCEATNIIGSTRVDQKLNVEYRPRITKITSWVGTDIGLSTELECQVDGNPTPNVIWRRRHKGGFPHDTLTTENVYRIERVNSQSFGFYVCTATVSGFRDESKEALVLRNGPPKPMSKKSQEAEEGELGTLECEVTSIPLPNSIKWFKYGKELDTNTGSGRFSTRQTVNLYTVINVLIIKEVKAGDFGYYNCTSVNDYGTSVDRIELKEKQTLPITYIIVGIILGFTVIFVIILVCVLYRRHFKKDDVGSVLENPDTTKTGSYTDTDSSSDKKREKADSPSTLMGQLRQGYTKDTYRFSADYDDMPYKEHVNGNNNGYRYIDPSDTYSDSNIYDGEYIRSDLGHSDRIVPLYSPTAGYNLSSFRGNNYDNSTPPPTMTRLTPLHMSNSKLATDV